MSYQATSDSTTIGYDDVVAAILGAQVPSELNADLTKAASNQDARARGARCICPTGSSGLRGARLCPLWREMCPRDAHGFLARQGSFFVGGWHKT